MKLIFPVQLTTRRIPVDAHSVEGDGTQTHIPQRSLIHKELIWALREIQALLLTGSICLKWRPPSFSLRHVLLWLAWCKFGPGGQPPKNENTGLSGLYSSDCNHAALKNFCCGACGYIRRSSGPFETYITQPAATLGQRSSILPPRCLIPCEVEHQHRRSFRR